MASTVLQETMAILGLAQKHTPAMTMLDLTAYIRKGLPYQSLERVSKRLEMTSLAMVESLGLAKRTVARRVQEKKPLSPTESERLVRLTRVFAEARQVLGSDDKARRWMFKPSRALGGELPLRLLDTDIGTNAVFDELGRIEHGVFA
ncbi:MAG TPA: antitoxin Xre/MbcA/ParS toxin-binding domain-containing protein [Kofleriaceae bacterium]